MKIELSQAELITAVEHYFNTVKFKEPVKISSVNPQKNSSPILHVEVNAEFTKSE